MARSEARLQFGIWRDGLDGLSPHAKLAYVVLLTEPTINHAGVGAVRESRWARNAGLTDQEMQKALGELVAGQYVFLDEDTEEVFVRTLIRNDRVENQPYVLKGALREALLTSSPTIRRALASELRKLPPRPPDGVSKSGRPVTYPDPHATADVLDPRKPPTPSRKASRNPSETLLEGSRQAPETLLGGGGGGGGGVGTSSSVGTSVGKPAQKRGDSDEVKTAQAITNAYVERVPLSKYPAVLGIVRRALRANHTPALVQAALLRLADEGRPVTVDTLRIELEGLPAQNGHLRSVPAPVRPSDPAEAFDDLRARGAAQEVARLIGAVWYERAQPPSDPTPRREWSHTRAVEFIDAHAAELRAALTERRTG